MDALITGAGTFVGVSALPMLLGLLLTETPFAVWLRRLAIGTALALPVGFMLIIALTYLSNPNAATFFDFEVNHNAAVALYAHGNSPYSISAAYSFPFPSFYLYWLSTGFGRWNETQAWIVWWLSNGLLWIGCVVILWRTLPRAQSPRERDIRYYASAAIPAMTTLWQGQTALFILAGLIALHLATLPERGRLYQILGGLGLAWASLIKPQLAIVGLGLILWGLLALRARRYDAVARIGVIIGSAVIIAMVLIGLTLILPGGVTLDTYREFASQALPHVAQPADAVVIGSPSFMAAAAAYQFGASDRIIDLSATIGTVIVLGSAAYWTIRRANRPLVEIAAGWGVWSMVAPRVAWVWYATWCLPFFLLFSREIYQHRWLPVWLVILLALLNFQPSSLVLAFIAILILMYLTWISFIER